jgi:hypothetical protein
MRSRFFAASLGCMLLLAGPAMAPAAAQGSLEYAVKAAYLTRFIPFISWPDAAFTAPTAPVTICVLGRDVFGGSLEKAAAGSRLAERAIAVRHLAGPDPNASCQILFIGAGDQSLINGTLDAMKGRPVVTVTDSTVRARGVIAFVIADNRVRFDIDDALASQGGLIISSKLLGLARSVKQRGQP